MTPWNDIYQFNKEAGLLEDSYNDSRESAYLIEEALEDLTTLDMLGNALNIREDLAESPKELSRFIVSLAHQAPWNLSDVSRFDKHLDAIVFAFGSLYKLGLTPEQALHGLQIVMDHNMAKLNMPKDAEGKLTKPKNFVGPEAQLQKILDERT